MEVVMSELISSLLANKELVMVQSNVSVYEVANLMASNRIGAIIVKDEDSLLGLISERDITRKVVSQGVDLHATKAYDILFSDVTILSPHETLEKAMQVITNTRRRHVLIEDKGEIISILSIGDLMKHLLDEKSNTIEHLQQYIYS